MAPGNNAEMPFLDHLEELRWRIIWSLVALVVGFVVAFALLSKVDLLSVLQQPILPYLGGERLKYTHPADPFKISVTAALAIGTVFALPVILYQVWAFLAPALYAHEKKVVIPVLIGGALLFLGGAALSFFFILPITLGFLYSFQDAGLDAMITWRDYAGFAIGMSFAMGAVFELPIVILGLTVIGIVTPAFLIRYRRHALVLCLVTSAFITPGQDPLSLLALSGALYLLFELSVILSTYVYRRREKRLAALAAEAAAARSEDATAARDTPHRLIDESPWEEASDASAAPRGS